MSVRVMAEVWEHSEHTGGSLLVLLALADWANDEGQCWPSTERLARKARISVRQLSRVLQQLVDGGDLTVPSGPRSRERPYQIRQYVDRTSVSDLDRPRLADPVRAQDTAVKEPPEGTTSDGAVGQQQTLITDAAAEVFVRWANVFDRWDATLTPARRRVAERVLREEPNLDALEEAMRGFKRHREHKPGGIELADIFGTYAGTSDLRSKIEWARRLATEEDGNGLLTVDQLLRNVPSDRHWIIRDAMSQAIAAIRRGRRDESAEAMVERSTGAKPLIADGVFKGWSK